MSRVCESWEQDIEVRSERDPLRTYTVSLTGPDGVTACTCPAYEFSKARPATCKHIKKALQGLCLWTEDEGPEIAVGELCPRCGGPTVERGAKYQSPDEDIPF